MKLFRPSFAGWVSAWAVATYLSAAVRTGGPEGLEEITWAGRVFDTADQIPPWAKIGFGATLALTFLLIGRIRNGLMLTAVALAVTPAVFAVSVLVYPFDYYQDFALAAFWPRHAAAGLSAGAAYAVTTIMGRARAERA